MGRALTRKRGIKPDLRGASRPKKDGKQLLKGSGVGGVILGADHKRDPLPNGVQTEFHREPLSCTRSNGGRKQNTVEQTKIAKGNGCLLYASGPGLRIENQGASCRGVIWIIRQGLNEREGRRHNFNLHFQGGRGSREKL